MLDRKICYVAIVPTSTAPVSRASPVITHPDRLGYHQIPYRPQLPLPVPNDKKFELCYLRLSRPKIPKSSGFSTFALLSQAVTAISLSVSQELSMPHRLVSRYFFAADLRDSVKQLLRKYLEKEGIREVTKDQNNQVRDGATSRGRQT